MITDQVFNDSLHDSATSGRNGYKMVIRDVIGTTLLENGQD